MSVKVKINHNHELLMHGLSGALGNAISTALLYPLDIIKIE